MKTMRKATRATANKFLKSHETAVLATVSESGDPSSTPITYVVSASGKIRFVTRDRTTKCLDIMQTGKVALSIVDSEKPISVNITGKATIIEDVSDAKSTMRAIGEISSKNNEVPHVLKFQRGDFVVVEIELERLQYTDFTKENASSGTVVVDL